MCETYVAYGKIHNEQPDKKTNQLRDVRAETTLVHYLICRYGLIEAFKKASGADIIVTTLDEFNPKDYPMEDYLVAQSTGSMPKGYRNYYEPTKLVVIVPRSQVNDMVFNMLAGFYYVVDHYPNLLKIDTVFQTDRWMQTLGRILRGNDANLGKVMMGMTRHFSSLESYVDQATAIRLKQRFPEVNDFFELLIHVVKHMNEWIRDSDDLTGTLWGKELVTFPYILSDWIAMCNRLSFKINAPTNLEVRPETLDKYVFKSFTPGAIYKLSHGHGEVSTDAVPGDNMLIKQTSVAIAQGSTTDHRDRVPADSPVMKMHASVMTVGHALFPSKPDPRGGYRLNPYVRFDETYQVLRETGNAVVDARITALDEFLKRSPKNYQYAPQAILEDDEDTIA
jgi:hypothetical protein